MNTRSPNNWLVLGALTIASIASCGGGSKHAVEAVDAAGTVDAPASTGGAAGARGTAIDGGLSDVLGAFNTGGTTGAGGAVMGGATTGKGGGLATGGFATGGGGATGGLGTTGGATATGGNVPTGGTGNTGGVLPSGGLATGGTFATGGNTPTGGNAGTGGASRLGGAGAGGSSATGGNTPIGGNTPTGGKAGTGGASRSGGAGAGGSSAMGGTTGIGSSGTAACGGVTVEGKLWFDGHSAIALDTVLPTLHHKRDIDPSEDRCLNSIVLIFSMGGACKLEVDVDSANTCRVDTSSSLGLHISRMRFEADSQCPGFLDAEEGVYSATATYLTGASIQSSFLSIGEANVASSCDSQTFYLKLTGSLRNATTGGILRFAPTGTSLTVAGKFLSTEGPGACPAKEECPGCGSGEPPCSPGTFCTPMEMCARPGAWTSCIDYSQCSGKDDCLSTPAGLRCRQACISNSECYLETTTAKPVCYAASNGDKTCQYDCSAAGSNCPYSMSCKTFAAGKFCSSEP